MRLGEFARSSLEEQAVSWGIDLGAFMHQAVVYYLSDRKSQRPGWPLPPFRLHRSSSGVKTEVSVALRQSEWSAIAHEAKRQGTNVEGLLQHAALYYLADMETGRVARRIALAAEGGMEGESGGRP